MYTLTINETQANIIKIALEEYFRIRMNQWSNLAEDLASVGYIYNPADPENKKKFDDYLRRRNETERFLKMAMVAAQPQRPYAAIQCSEQSYIAQDIWQVMRNRLYLDSGGDPNGWCVDARKPLQVSSEPLPMMEKKIIDTVNGGRE